MSNAKFENDVVRIFVNQEVGSVVVEWITSPTSAEFREVLVTGLDILKKNKLSRWVGDVRRLGAVAEEDQAWSNQEWFPEALSAGVNKMAVIISEDIFNQLSVEDIMNKVDTANFSTHYFSAPEEAMHWIKNN
jgi:hypothetical protein